jgi:hypothetical protein
LAGGNVAITDTTDFSFLANKDGSINWLAGDFDEFNCASYNAAMFADGIELLNDLGEGSKSCCCAITVFVNDTNNNENATIIVLKMNNFVLMQLIMLYG